MHIGRDLGPVERRREIIADRLHGPLAVAALQDFRRTVVEGDHAFWVEQDMAVLGRLELQAVAAGEPQPWTHHLAQRVANAIGRAEAHPLPIEDAERWTSTLTNEDNF